jgi:hypothetical protein
MKAHTWIALTVLALGACAPIQGRNDTAVARQIGVPPTAAIDALLLGDFDTNRDRLISQPEFAAGAVQAWLTASKGAPKIGIIALQAWQVTVFGSADALPRFAFDSEFDGDITQEKFLNGLNSRFFLLDANKDGQISRPELYRRAVGAAQTALELPGPPGGPPRGRPPQR